MKWIVYFRLNFCFLEKHFFILYKVEFETAFILNLIFLNPIFSSTHTFERVPHKISAQNIRALIKQQHRHHRVYATKNQINYNWRHMLNCVWKFIRENVTEHHYNLCLRVPRHQFIKTKTKCCTHHNIACWTMFVSYFFWLIQKINWKSFYYVDIKTNPFE